MIPKGLGEQGRGAGGRASINGREGFLGAKVEVLGGS